MSTKHRSSYIKPFLPLGEGFHLLFGHRGVMHSLLAVFVLSGAVLMLHHFYGGSFLLYTAFAFGYFSHLLADSLTKSGMPLLYPYKKPIRFLPKVLALRIGSLNETLLFALLAFVLVLWFKTNPQFLKEFMDRIYFLLTFVIYFVKILKLLKNF